MLFGITENVVGLELAQAISLARHLLLVYFILVGNVVVYI